MIPTTGASEEEVIYAREFAVKATDFRDVLVESGLGAIRPVNDLDRLQRMLDHANFVVTARLPQRDNRLIGIARAVTDLSWCCFLSDLAVTQDAKGRGVGRRLLETMRELLGPEISLILASVPNAVGFYESIEMEPLPHCFLYRRER